MLESPCFNLVPTFIYECCIRKKFTMCDRVCLQNVFLKLFYYCFKYYVDNKGSINYYMGFVLRIRKETILLYQLC